MVICTKINGNNKMINWIGFVLGEPYRICLLKVESWNPVLPSGKELDTSVLLSEESREGSSLISEGDDLSLPEADMNKIWTDLKESEGYT